MGFFLFLNQPVLFLSSDKHWSYVTLFIYFYYLYSTAPCSFTLRNWSWDFGGLFFDTDIETEAWKSQFSLLRLITESPITENDTETFNFLNRAM